MGFSEEQPKSPNVKIVTVQLDVKVDERVSEDDVLLMLIDALCEPELPEPEAARAGIAGRAHMRLVMKMEALDHLRENWEMIYEVRTVDCKTYKRGEEPPPEPDDTTGKRYVG